MSSKPPTARDAALLLLAVLVILALLLWATLSSPPAESFCLSTLDTSCYHSGA